MFVKVGKIIVIKLIRWVLLTLRLTILNKVDYALSIIGSKRPETNSYSYRASDFLY